MPTPLDIKLSKIQKTLTTRLNGQVPATMEEFILSSNFPQNCIFDIKKLFKDIVIFYRTVKNRKEPDIVLWLFIRDVMLDNFQKSGDNTNKYYDSIRKSLGYDRNRPESDWQSEAGKESVDLRLDRQPQVEQKIEKQFSDIKEISKEDLDQILANESSNERKVIHPDTHEETTEREYVEERRAIYRRDYVLNDSADKPLLNEIIMSELQILRFDIYLRNNPNRFAGNHRDLVFEKLCKAQKALGISREQRVETEEQMKDTLADLVDTFEVYRNNGVDLNTMFALEELEMLLQRHDRGEKRGTEELTEFMFKYFTYGTTIDQARKILADNYHLMKEIEKKAMDLQL